MIEVLIRGAVCTVCGCCCDDLNVEVTDGRVERVENACSLALSKFKHYSSERILKPLMRVGNGFKETSYKEAIQESARLLVNSNYPVLWGWCLTSCEAVELGLELAELVGGVIDNNSSVCHGPGLIGVQDIGISGCSLGEVKNRADLILYWGSNPVNAHPRHMARYTALAKGRFVASRRERKLIVVDVRRTETAKLADEFYQIEPNSDYELLTALRCAVNGEEIELSTVSGLPVERVEELAEALISCRFGVLFYGLGLTMTYGKSRNLDAALSLVRDLNRKTKFLIMPMRGHFNVTGSNEVFTWVTGYPFGVDLSKGYPEYNPGITTISDVLRRGECDAALIVASDPIAHLPSTLAETLKKIPLITIDPHRTPTTEASQIVIPSAIVGLESTGTVYRMDGVPLECKRILDPPPGVKTDVEIMSDLLSRVKELLT
ncbi:MAG: formylmethanofuran dehydrogenase subunit B [Candidatus Bathyarchaeia archaeon]